MDNWFNFPDDVSLAPTSEGVYLLSESASDNDIVYVGRAENLRERLSQHPDPNNPCLQRKNIRYFAYEVTDSSEITEQVLINMLNPPCNRI